MTRTLRWALGLLLAAGVLFGAFLFLPFRSWLPGGTVADGPARLVVNGAAFNRLFPKPRAGEELIFTQEKRGFSQARLKEGESTKALLSISDVLTAPEARNKFRDAHQRLGAWPLVEQGTRASALLVADRFQVKVIGQGVGLDEERRHALLSGFNLPALAALKPVASAEPLPLPGGEEKPLRLSPPPAEAVEFAPSSPTPALEPAP